MATHYIPKDLRGETRILVIFTVKSLITTAIFGGVGVIFFLLFSALQMRLIGFNRVRFWDNKNSKNNRLAIY